MDATSFVDKINGSTVLPSNPSLSGKTLLYQQYLESKQKQEEERKKKRVKETKKDKNNKRKIKKNFFSLQRTGLEN
jgi:hypothetical protein